MKIQQKGLLWKKNFTKYDSLFYKINSKECHGKAILLTDNILNFQHFEYTDTLKYLKKKMNLKVRTLDHLKGNVQQKGFYW